MKQCPTLGVWSHSATKQPPSSVLIQQQQKVWPIDNDGSSSCSSASCPSAMQVCIGISVSNGVQLRRNFLKIFYGPEDTQWAKKEPGRWAVESTTHQGTPGRPRRALMGCALHRAPLHRL